jgi:O-antigen ligase
MRSKQDLDLALKMLLFILGLQCCVFFIQTVFEVSFSPTGQIMRRGMVGDTGMRANGTVGTVPSAFATFVEPLTFIALALFQTGERPALKWWGGLLGLMGLGAIALTLNRSSWGGLLIGFVVFALVCVMTESRKRHGVKLLLALLVLSCIFAALFPMISERMANKANHIDVRMNLIRPAIELIKDHPLLGVGPGAYPFVIREYIGDFTGWLYYVHNDYLLIWAERGALGLVAWLWWFFAGMWQANRARRRLPQPWRACAIGCLTSFVVLLWEAFWNSYEPFSSTALIWFLFGLLLAANKMSAQSRATSRQYHSSAVPR